MKIITWNVNGIRAIAKKGFVKSISEIDADIICLQEVKAFLNQFIDELSNIPSYKFFWHAGTKPGYAGTAILYKENLDIRELKNVFEGYPMFSEDGRVTSLIMELKGSLCVLLNVYFPNGGTRADGSEMLSYKLDFYNKIIAYANLLVASGKNVIITGDFNICHESIDIARPKDNENNIGFLPIERAKITEFLGAGYIDTFRHKYRDKAEVYSWWSYRAGVRQRNIGWRLDYFLVNRELISSIEDTKYLTTIEGSDHCPVELIL